ncbi:MAG: hypothetical protein GY730_09450, partial [bacterium]|nr:hypothetical protein [bacterium]
AGYQTGIESIYDLDKSVTDYYIDHKVIVAGAKYNIPDLFRVSLVSQMHSYGNLSGAKNNLTGKTSDVTSTFSLTKKIEDKRIDLYMGKELFVLQRGETAQVFNTSYYGLSYLTKIFNQNILSINASNFYYSSFEAFRQHYAVYWSSQNFLKLKGLELTCQHKYITSPQEHINALQIAGAFNFFDFCTIKPGYRFTINSLKRNSQHKIIIDFNIPVYHNLKFNTHAFLATERLNNKDIETSYIQISVQNNI